MFNFIYCDDQEEIRKNISKVIIKLMMNLKIEYKIYEFSSYNKEFEQLIDKKISNKIYILDIELGKTSGLDIAKIIREKDWNAKIIFLSVHSEVAYEIFQKRLGLLNFISKFDNYEKNLYEDLNLALTMSEYNPYIVLKSKGSFYKVGLDEIIYISTNEEDRKIKIKTISEEYMSSLPLKKIQENLDKRFFRTHRACIVNKEKIKAIDFKINKIRFVNGEEIYLLSNSYRKDLKKICTQSI